MDYPVYFSGQLKTHLRSLRKTKGLTQARLGQIVGLPQPRIAELEANPGAVSVNTLFKVLGALDALVLLRDKTILDSLPTIAGAASTRTKSEVPSSEPPKSKGQW